MHRCHGILIFLSFLLFEQKGIHECGEIAYIDVVNGDTDGFVRCACQEAAAKLAETSLTNHTFSLVQGNSLRLLV